MVMKTYSIGFCDMGRDFDEHDNVFVNALKKEGVSYEISDKPDVLFYSVFGNRHNLYTDCIKVFFIGEPIAPDFNECDYAIGFDKMTFGNRYLRRPLWFPDRCIIAPMEITDEKALSRKFCNFIYSNDKDGNAVKLRTKFAKLLMEYKRVDCPGRVLNNMTSDLLARENKDWVRSKVEFLKDYKFTISFENSKYDGYTTEKMLNPLSAKSIPIYWGNPGVEEDFNPEAFVNANGYEDKLEDLVKKIIELDNDDAAYLKMIHANPMKENYNQKKEREKFDDFIINIVTGDNIPFAKDPLNFRHRMTFLNLSRKEKIMFFLRK